MYEFARAAMKNTTDWGAEEIVIYCLTALEARSPRSRRQGRADFF